MFPYSAVNTALDRVEKTTTGFATKVRKAEVQVEHNSLTPRVESSARMFQLPLESTHPFQMFAFRIGACVCFNYLLKVHIPFKCLVFELVLGFGFQLLESTRPFQMFWFQIDSTTCALPYFEEDLASKSDMKDVCQLLDVKVGGRGWIM